MVCFVYYAVEDNNSDDLADAVGKHNGPEVGTCRFLGLGSAITIPSPRVSMGLCCSKEAFYATTDWLATVSFVTVYLRSSLWIQSGPMARQFWSEEI